MLRRTWLLAVLAVILLALGAAPPIILWRARVIATRFHRDSQRTGRPMENALPSVLARIAAVSPPFRSSARRQEAGFWLTFARSGERAEAREGVTRRLSTRIARAFSDAIRADAAFAATRAVPALMRRSRFDLAGRKRGRALERTLRSELELSRWLSGSSPRSCEPGDGGGRWSGMPLEVVRRPHANKHPEVSRWLLSPAIPGPRLAPSANEPPYENWRYFVDLVAGHASAGHDDRALSALDRSVDERPVELVDPEADDGSNVLDDRALFELHRASVAGAPEELVESLRGLILLRRGDAAEAEERFRALARSTDETTRLAARTGRALALLGLERPDDALFAISAEPGQPAFAMVRLVASFVTGDTAGARAALRRIPRTRSFSRLRDELEHPLALWSTGHRKESRAELSRVVAQDPASWDFLLPLARYVAGHSNDVDAWLELSAPRDGLARVWQLYALERAARERGNVERADDLRALRRRICR